MGDSSSQRVKGIVGDLDTDYWIYDSETGFDLTRPQPITAGPRNGAIALRTTTSSLFVDPTKTALVVIDMQNFFLSPALGRSKDSKGLQAEKQLLDHALPAARKAGIKVVWLNWGLTDGDLHSMPPAVHKSFGINTMSEADFESRYGGSKPDQSLASSKQVTTSGKSSGAYIGLGNDLGEVTPEDGQTIQAGRMLMRDQWNTQNSPPLQRSYEASLKTSQPDAWVHKLRMSGKHLPDSDANKYFREHDIKTLLFAGVNTDQCVGGTLVDAFAQGYDCIMLKDGCATSSPDSAQECWEYNSAKTFGFMTDCETFARDVESSTTAERK